MTVPPSIVPLSWRYAPAPFEALLQMQKLSAEVFKERKAGAGVDAKPGR
jgi:hypothetical protein